MGLRYRHWVFAVLIACFAGAASAQQDISGTWQGNLAVAPDQNLTIHFVLTRAADGTYSGMVTSPDMGGIKDIPANTVSFEANRLVMTVDELSGAYDGTLANGTLTGEWRQEGSAFPLVLSPYERPVLSQAAIDFLTGEWSGKLETPVGISLTIVLRFETSADGQFVGFLDSPDQGARGIPMTDLQFVDNSLSVNVPRVQGVFTATATADALTGTWSQGGGQTPLALTRGAYTPTVTALGLTGATFGRLAGTWKGQLGPLELMIRFERAEGGESVGYLDVPAQGASNVPVTEASLTGDQLTLRIAAIGATYTAALAGSELSGQWQQGPVNNPLTLTRE